MRHRVGSAGLRAATTCACAWHKDSNEGKGLLSRHKDSKKLWSTWHKDNSEAEGRLSRFKNSNTSCCANGMLS
eukprot:1158524-Pelagomonas_calceolata.AAC.1